MLRAGRACPFTNHEARFDCERLSFGMERTGCTSMIRAEPMTVLRGSHLATSSLSNWQAFVLAPRARKERAGAMCLLGSSFYSPGRLSTRAFRPVRWVATGTNPPASWWATIGHVSVEAKMAASLSSIPALWLRFVPDLRTASSCWQTVPAELGFYHPELNSNC